MPFEHRSVSFVQVKYYSQSCKRIFLVILAKYLRGKYSSGLSTDLRNKII